MTSPIDSLAELKALLTSPDERGFKVSITSIEKTRSIKSMIASKVQTYKIEIARDIFAGFTSTEPSLNKDHVKNFLNELTELIQLSQTADTPAAPKINFVRPHLREEEPDDLASKGTITFSSDSDALCELMESIMMQRSQSAPART